MMSSRISCKCIGRACTSICPVSARASVSSFPTHLQKPEHFIKRAGKGFLIRRGRLLRTDCEFQFARQDRQRVRNSCKTSAEIGALARMTFATGRSFRSMSTSIGAFHPPRRHGDAALQIMCGDFVRRFDDLMQGAERGTGKQPPPPIETNSTGGKQIQNVENSSFSIVWMFPSG